MTNKINYINTFRRQMDETVNRPMPGRNDTSSRVSQMSASVELRRIDCLSAAALYFLNSDYRLSIFMTFNSILKLQIDLEKHTTKNVIVRHA